MRLSKIIICFIFYFFVIITPALSAINGLTAQIFTVPGLSRDNTAVALAHRIETINKVSEVLETILYAQMGKENAFQQGRRIFKDYHHGTITIVDTRENQQKVTNYIAQLHYSINQNTGLTFTRPRGRVISIRHADPNNIRNLLNQVFQELRAAQIPYLGSGRVGDFITGIITPGPGNGLTFLDITVELIDIIGQDTATAQAQLYAFTFRRDREFQLTNMNSELIDGYRVRLLELDPRRQEAEIEIRVASGYFIR